ncbi:MAG: signal peptide peptidase SppA [Saprospiraceae bacterium]|nr:signal peptide peptidase SppA [Saprospiraceae bacterium]
MRQFFKFFSASCLGTIVGLVLLVGLFFVIGSGIVSQMDKSVSVGPNSILELTFEDAVPEKTNNLQDTPFELSDKKYIGLNDYRIMIEHAAKDDRIKGILLRPDMTNMSMAEAAVLRKALSEFQESGKFIYAYGKFMTQNTYYLCSVADSVYLNPLGTLEFRGISADVTYFKKMLDKLGIGIDVFYAGQFKSATEPFRADHMSDANRVQLRAYIEDLFDIMLDDISTSRNKSKEELRAIAQNWKTFDPDSASTSGLLDALLYEDQLTKRIKDRLGLETKEDVPFIAAQDYYKSSVSKLDLSGKDKIALVFLEGEINIGKDEGGIITDDHYQKILDKIAKDEKVKAVVLRVNSPGGSVLASENILRGIRNIQAKGIPIVVTMGRYAASGGYYISCYADSIFAQPSTLTGSIGVFSLMPNFGPFLDQKIGITFDTVKTTDASTYFTGVYGLGDKEKQLMQGLTDGIYQDFLEKVAEGRKLSVDSVHQIAQGRVWTGKRAVENGLVDKLGYTEDAIACAARMASLEKYRIDEYPKTKDPLQRLLSKITGEEDASAPMVRKELGQWYGYYEKMKSLRRLEGPQVRLPFLIEE